jgi:hypothetical protein
MERVKKKKLNPAANKSEHDPTGNKTVEVLNILMFLQYNISSAWKSNCEIEKQDKPWAVFKSLEEKRMWRDTHQSPQRERVSNNTKIHTANLLLRQCTKHTNEKLLIPNR